MDTSENLIPLKGTPNSDFLIKLTKGSVSVSYNDNGQLRLIRGTGKGKRNFPPKEDETILVVEDFQKGVANFKSGSASSGFYSMDGEVFWSSVWEDAGPQPIKKATFQEWIDECARVLAGDQEAIQQ